MGVGQLADVHGQCRRGYYEWTKHSKIRRGVTFNAFMKQHPARNLNIISRPCWPQTSVWLRTFGVFGVVPFLRLSHVATSQITTRVRMERGKCGRTLYDSRCDRCQSSVQSNVSSL